MAELQVLDAEPLGTDVVTKLEEALESARAGKVSSIAIAVVYRDGYTGRAWSKTPSMSLLIGATARLQAGLIEAVDG